MRGAALDQRPTLVGVGMVVLGCRSWWRSPRASCASRRGKWGTPAQHDTPLGVSFHQSVRSRSDPLAHTNISPPNDDDTRSLGAAPTRPLSIPTRPLLSIPTGAAHGRRAPPPPLGGGGGAPHAPPPLRPTSWRARGEYRVQGYLAYKRQPLPPSRTTIGT